MLTFTQGNLLKSEAEALINTVNEVGVMGKGIALMFRERFPKNTREYELACKRGDVHVGKMFVTASGTIDNPKWIINFPTKKHWRSPSQLEWIRDGLTDLVRVILDLKIKSVALPPLGCGNGGLDWNLIKPMIVDAFSSISSLDVQVYEPTQIYQNVPKQMGLVKLTPSRALIVDMVRRYSILGFECSLLEIQKLAWFLGRGLKHTHLDDPLKLKFVARQYGPYADNLRHVLESVDGSYLMSEKRVADSSPYNVIGFSWDKSASLDSYLEQPQMMKYHPAISWTQAVIEGFESPFGMELLATVDWLITERHVDSTVNGLRKGLKNWPYGIEAANRKNDIFDDRVLGLALDRLVSAEDSYGSQKKLF